MRCAYLASSPLHLKDFRTERQKAFVQLNPVMDDTNIVRSHAFHHAHTNTLDPLDPEYYIMSPMQELVSGAPLMLRPYRYVERSLKPVILGSFKSFQVSLQVLKNIGLCCESVGHIFSSILGTLLSPTCPWIFVCVHPNLSGVVLLSAAMIGYLFSYLPVTWGGHGRNDVDYQNHCTKSWAVDQIETSYNVYLPCCTTLQKWLAFDYAWMIEHHLFPHASTTCWGSTIQGHVLQFCTAHKLVYKVDSIPGVFHRMFISWHLSESLS